MCVRPLRTYDSNDGYDPGALVTASTLLGILCNASAYGIGAVMSHVMPDGSERPVLFTSR